MSVKLHEIMSAAHARSASLAAEVAGYLVLATADQIAGAPRCLGFSDVSLSEEGQVRIAGGTPVEDVAAERTLREMLGLLLLESSSVTPGLFRAAHKSPAAGVDALIREIEIALVPVNRAAARRALTRLHRDVERARQAGRLAPWQPPRRSPEPAARQSVPPPAAPEPAPAPRAESAPAPKEPTESIELPSVLTRDSSPPPIGAGERSWLTPDSVAVVDVEWPAQAPASDDELYTAIPVYVEELEPEAPARTVPVVPDLEVPPSEEAPPARVAALPEPVTVPQPLVTPRPLGPSEPVARSDAHTPVLGSRLAVQAAAPLPPLEVSEPTPGVLVLVGDDATERMPRVIDEEDEAAEIARALAEVTRAFVESPDPVDGLETLDPPLAAEAAQAEAAPVAAAAAQAQVEPSEAQAAAAQGRRRRSSRRLRLSRSCPSPRRRRCGPWPSCRRCRRRPRWSWPSCRRCRRRPCRRWPSCRRCRRRPCRRWPSCRRCRWSCRRRRRWRSWRPCRLAPPATTTRHRATPRARATWRSCSRGSAWLSSRPSASCAPI
ncbi:MAG: hypothetical protein HS104_14725 [Polyangiaceae bacterium]|nr:hypothetical protein [Polyangiaceae bacterium]